MTPLSFAPMRADTMISRWPRWDVGTRNCIFYRRFVTFVTNTPNLYEINQPHVRSCNQVSLWTVSMTIKARGNVNTCLNWISTVFSKPAQNRKGLEELTGTEHESQMWVPLKIRFANCQMAVKPLGILANLQKSLKNLTRFSSFLMSFVCFKKVSTRSPSSKLDRGTPLMSSNTSVASGDRNTCNKNAKKKNDQKTTKKRRYRWILHLLRTSAVIWCPDHFSQSLRDDHVAFREDEDLTS